MKKHLLLFLFTFSALLMIAQVNHSSITGPCKDLKLKKVELSPNQISPFDYGQITKAPLATSVIGSTWYDGQALNYGNMMQRVWAYEDGSLGAIWLSSGPDLDPERGCGYNYYDGTSWGTEEPHVGSAERMGTPSYAKWGENGEILTQYYYPGGQPGSLRFYKRDNKGTGEWEMTELLGPDNLSLVWQSMITSGENHETIHLLAYTYDAPYLGQENALLYYRSNDGAETWEIQGEIIDGLGYDDYATMSSTSYAWANPVGNTIAFNYGFDQFGGKVFKSNDNGDSWDMIDVYTTPYSDLDPPADADPFGCGIGTSACALDSEGNAHVVFARMLWDWVATESHYYPYTDGLIYWNETMEPLDTTSISSYTLDFLEEGGNLIGWLDLELTDGQPTYFNALWGFPQMSIDDEDNLFVATSTLSDYMTSENYFYRHIFVNASFDGGLTWGGQTDLNDGAIYLISECAFPGLAPIIDDKVHIVYQEDYAAGMHEWAEEHAIVENTMTWMSFEKEFFVGVEDKAAIADYSLSEGFPNPANEQMNFNLTLSAQATATMTLSNMIGQVVQTTTVDDLHLGSNRLSLDVSNLSPGTYFCTIMVNNTTQTRKIIVR